MEMELYYVLETEQKVILEEGEEPKEIAKYLSGPFGNWHAALDSKSEIANNRLSTAKIRIASTKVEVEINL